MAILAEEGIESQRDLQRASSSAHQAICAKRKFSSDDEEALARLLEFRVDCAEVPCVRGCGLTLAVNRMRRHNCVRELREEMDRRFMTTKSLQAKIKELTTDMEQSQGSTSQHNDLIYFYLRRSRQVLER